MSEVKNKTVRTETVKTETALTVALMGNPNVGKSTVFNRLTGMNQHTGNWPGKTVGSAVGKFSYKGVQYSLVDLPGTYSLFANSVEEEIARDFITGKFAEKPELIIAVCDATCLERSLNLVLQTIRINPNVIVCLNLIDEAEKKQIYIDIKKLENLLNVPVVALSAAKNKGFGALLETVYNKELKFNPVIKNLEENPIVTVNRAEKICGETVTFENADYNAADRKTDKILTSKGIGIPVMLLLLTLVFWLTITGSNYPSALLADFLFFIQDKLLLLFKAAKAPEWLSGALIMGVYRNSAWVVAVMLPPMAIFFPLFTLLEDFGYLPRVAFNLDRAFQKCRACGKQALTMCMGFGCNAAGVTGCRIINSPRERLIAILTNNFVPCNGRFPTLIALITIFFVNGSESGIAPAALLTVFILFGIFLTFGASKFLSSTVLKGEPSFFALELPPYRRPQFGKVIVRSVFDRALTVLGRAAAVAAPAGLIVWSFANIHINGVSLLGICVDFLDPFARAAGMDGVILTAFILGFPANETVIPIMIMAYMSAGYMTDAGSLAELHTLFAANGWTPLTALCVMLFSVSHWPCSTACLTIKKETGSLKWTLFAIIMPTIAGFAVCFTVAGIARLLFI